METLRDTVRRNVKRLREERRHTVRSLSGRLGEEGRPLLPSGITKIEEGSRRVDVDDLVALAVALGVNPSRLLLPDRADEEPVALTPATAVPAWSAWQWADGRYPLPTRPGDDPDEPYNSDGEYEDFQRFARPADMRLAQGHTAARAAQDLAERLRRYLTVTEEDRRAGSALARKRADSVRRALARLTAEVDDLLEGGHGER